MDVHSNKITKIKSTIDEIRQDIENMKNKNEKTMSNMINSLSKITNYNENSVHNKNPRNAEINELEEKSQIQDFDNNKDLYLNEFQSHSNHRQEEYRNIPEDYEGLENNYENQEYNEIYKKTGQILYANHRRDFEKGNENPEVEQRRHPSSHNYSNMVYDKQIHSGGDAYNQNNSAILEKQISELHIEIDELQRKNTYLQMALAESKKDHSFMKSANFSPIASFDLEHAKRNENLIEEIKSILKLQSANEILPSIAEMIELEQRNNIKNQFIDKLWDLYKVLMGEQIEKEVDIVKLWRWIKYIIKEMRILNEKCNDVENNRRRGEDVYKKFCEKLIYENKLRNFEELDFFINRLLDKNQINQKRVEKIKNLLMAEPNAAKFQLSYEIPK